MFHVSYVIPEYRFGMSRCHGTVDHVLDDNLPPLVDDVTDIGTEPDTSDEETDDVALLPQLAEDTVTKFYTDDGIWTGPIGIPGNTSLCAICGLYYYGPYSNHTVTRMGIEDHSYEYTTDEDDVDISEHQMHMIKLSYFKQYRIRNEVMPDDCWNLFLNPDI
jgi:hypothetical protein